MYYRSPVSRPIPDFSHSQLESYLPSKQLNFMSITTTYYYCQVIDNFARAWCNLSKKFNISTTPKIHILTQHLCDYFDDSDLSLIKVTDEIVESCHQFFNKKIMQGYKVKNLCNPAHGVLLYSAVRTHNTYNLKIKKWVSVVCCLHFCHHVSLYSYNKYFPVRAYH